MLRITVPLQPDEMDALIILAQRERRDPRDQAAVLIRGMLIARGLLPADTMPAAFDAASRPNDRR